MNRPQTSMTCRRAIPADTRAIVPMLDRCSPASLRSRFGSYAADHALAARWFSGALENGRPDLWVIEDRRGRVLAIGDVARDELWYDLALLVVDACQRNGLGTMLLSHILADLHARGATTARVTTRTAGLTIVNRFKDRLGLTTRCIHSMGEAEVFITIP